MTKPLIYIAGPISKGWLPDNIRSAVEWAESLFDDGAIPIVPHTHGTLWELMSPHPHDYWMEIDFGIILRCDGLLRLPGESKGADMEVELAVELGIPILVVPDDNMVPGKQWEGFIELCAARRAR